MIHFGFKKIITSILLVAFLAAPLATIAPEKAQALISTVPTNNPSLDLKETGFSVFGVSTGISLDGLAFMAANVVIARITDSIVNWINSGFQGSPAFVEDPGSWFLETADIATGAFINQLGVADFLCSPLQPIRFSIASNYNRRFALDYKCKLSTVLNNVQNFTDYTSGNFTGQGGWNTWFDMTQNQSNNAFGVYVGSKIELDKRIANAIGLESDKLEWGSGFLSIQRCTLWDTPNGQEPGPNNPTSGNIPHRCIQYSTIETPGSIVEDQLNNALDSERSRILVADEINEILSALANQLVKTVFTAGLSNSGSAGGGGIYDPSTVNADFHISCIPSSDNLELTPNAQLGGALQTQPINWISQVTGGVPGQTNYLWTDFTGEPIPRIPSSITNSTTSPVVFTTPGVKWATVRATRGNITKTASCSLNVPIPPSPPIAAASCTITPSSLRQNDPVTITLNATGGVLEGPGSKMGICNFERRTDRGSGILTFNSDLMGNPGSSSCVATTTPFSNSPGTYRVSARAFSGGQASNVIDCGSLIVFP